MYINRINSTEIKNSLLKSGKIVILYGPRQAGKTTLINDILSRINRKKLIISADEKKYSGILSSRDSSKFNSLISGYDILFLDEAQRIEDIGLNLKILHDTFPKLRVIVTGSSSLDLASKIREPLTGRTKTFKLLPFGICELKEYLNPFEIDNRLENFLIYGLYPEAYKAENFSEKENIISEISESYLFKDIFELSGIKKHKKIEYLVKLLAFQTGSQVSIKELGNNLSISKDTAAHYIDLLEKSFVIFRLSGFSRNLRKEVVKMDKYFFFDNGIRNAVIRNFNSINLRDDTGRLWENFIISERYKRNLLNRYSPAFYYWRTYSGAELDYIEEKDGKLAGYEIKWSNKAVKAPKTWVDTYNGSFKVINRENWQSFVT